MKIKKSIIETLYVSLNYPIKNFSKARVRDTFLKKLGEEYKKYTEEKSKIITELCEKKDDKPIVEDDKYKFTPENEAQAVKEVEILNNEEIEIDLSKEIKELIKNSEAELKTGMADTLSTLI